MTPRCSRLHLCLSIVAGLVAIGLSSASAQDAKPQPAPKQTPARPAPDSRARASLDAARAAIAKLQSLAYTATTTAPGEKPGKGNVFIKKADAGGWKIATRMGEGESLRIAAYDGLSARAVDDEQKIVWEQSTEQIRATRGVFARRAVDQGVIWELLNDEDWLEADLAFQNTATVDGLPCEVITLRAKGSAPQTTDAAKPGPDAPSTMREVRLFLSKTDHLPRRIIRRTESGPNPVQVTIQISDIEIDKAIPDSYFNVDAPSGYRVKAANPPPPKPVITRPAAPKPDPDSDPDSAPASFGLAIGAEAPAFTLKDAAGQDHPLSEYKGKVVVLDFWGSWCPPCRAAMPGIQRLHEKYKDKPVAVLGLNFEQSAKAEPAKFMKDKGFTYGLLLNAETIARDYKITGWPTFYILDQQGRIAWSAIGHDSAHDAQMSKVIDGLLAK